VDPEIHVSNMLDPIIAIPNCHLLSIDPEKQASNNSSRDTACLYSMPWSEGGIELESDI